MVLTDDLGERFRAQPVSKRTRCAFLQSGSFEEVGHAGVI